MQRTESLEGAWRSVASGISDAAVQYRPLFSDQSATPGLSYWYRVIARNDAGRSGPSEPYGPVKITHRTLVDELWNDSRIFLTRGSLHFRSDQARRFKEDAHSVSGKDDAAVIYRTDGPIIGGRVWAFTEDAGPHLRFSLSRDGTAFQRVEARVETLAAGDTPTYGYWIPIRYRLDDVPLGQLYLQIEFQGGPVRATRVELEYGE